MTGARWLFADQLGPHFYDDTDDQVLLIESKAVFRRRRFHRRKAHLVLSALRHAARDLGERTVLVRTDTYGAGLAAGRDQLGMRPTDDLTVCAPTSRVAQEFVASLEHVEVLPARGFASSREEFQSWAGDRGGKRLLLEDFYRDARRRLGVLMDGSAPAGGRWNYDSENREPPPRSGQLPTPMPVWPAEDDLDEEVRADLDAWERDGEVAFVGSDGPRRFAATRAEAVRGLDDFVEHRLPDFGRWEDAILSGDPWMAHSQLSAPLNLGLLDPMECVHAAEDAYRAGAAPIAAVEGYVRQLIGWRDYVWHVYWHTGAEYRHRNALHARRSIPDWFADLRADEVDAACLSHTLAGVRDEGWVHHIPRLMILGSWALQRGYDPAALTDWFHRSFVDGYDWVMVPNVVGMSQHAGHGLMATKPYTSGGAYIDRMSDFCGSCRYDPKVRVGDTACPFTAGYWWFLNRRRDELAGNYRLAQPLRQLDRLRDLDEVVEQEDRRGRRAP